MAVHELNGNYLATVYDITGDNLPDAFDISGTRIGMDRKWKVWADVAKIANNPIDGVKQGGCTDGTYFYQISLLTDEDGNAHLLKYNIKEGTYTVKHYWYTSIFHFGHANDMTYNPNDGYLYICRMETDGSVIVIDADSLEFVKMIYLTNASGEPYTVWQFCYDRLNDCYYSANGAYSLVYDNNWNYLRSIEMPNRPDATQQGCETDGEYIYRLTYNPNYIDVAKIDGTYVTTINMTIPDEPESIMYDWDGHYYVSTNGVRDNGGFYSATLFD